MASHKKSHLLSHISINIEKCLTNISKSLILIAKYQDNKTKDWKDVILFPFKNHLLNAELIISILTICLWVL